MSLFHTKSYLSVLGLAALLVVLLTPAVARADYTICAVGSIQTNDSGFTIPSGPNAGDTEDYWSNGNSGLSKAIKGIKIEVTYSGGGEGTWADGNGCADFSGSRTNATVKISSETKRGGNRLVLHDDPFDFTPQSPSWAYIYTGQTLSSNQTYTYTGIGAGIAKWTALFTANFTLDYWRTPLSGADIYLGVEESCPSDLASAHYGSPGASESNSEITQGRHWLGITSCSPWTFTRDKFLVAHEMGHAIAALFYGQVSGSVDGDEPNTDDYTNDNDPARAPNSSACTNNAFYSELTKEWNSVTFREGYAHFVAAAAWNDRNDSGAAGGSGTGQEGAFTWFGRTHDLERFNLGAGSGSGGRMENICCQDPPDDCSTSWDSAGTNADWLRFLWDYFTVTSCTNNPTRKDMLKIYRKTRLNGGLTKGNYYTKTRNAMRNIYGATCLRNEFDTWANWNGINHDT